MQAAKTHIFCYTLPHESNTHCPSHAEAHTMGIFTFLSFLSRSNDMAKKAHSNEPVIAARPPVVVIMGHIDHGKSTLLDHIRKSNVVEGEAGGITQHLSAYVVEHETKDQGKKKITFLDTPGHAAFQKMRHRGADVADIAILIVSAEDGVMPQTLEALKCIKAANIPYIVAINKIDKPGADVVRTQSSLIENEIYIEGMGGDVPWAGISAKTGEGVDELLDVLLLAAEFAELKGEQNVPATGNVIEVELDKKRGTTATLIIKNGELKSGQFVVSGGAFAPVRIMEDWNGRTIKEAGLSEPVRIVGFSGTPVVGDPFTTVENKKEAEVLVAQKDKQDVRKEAIDPDLPIIPILIKADVLGTIDAIEHELDKFESDRVMVRVIGKRVGDITSGDVQDVSATENAIIVGFNVKTEHGAIELAERLKVEIKDFDIIYELSDWLQEALKDRTPKMETEEKTGRAKILKHFSTQKNIRVLGGRVEEGTLAAGEQVKIIRRDMEIGRGVLKNLQQQKSDVKEVNNDEFGMQVETKTEIAPGDHIETFRMVIT